MTELEKIIEELRLELAKAQERFEQLSKQREQEVYDMLEDLARHNDEMEKRYNDRQAQQRAH